MKTNKKFLIYFLLIVFILAGCNTVDNSDDSIDTVNSDKKPESATNTSSIPDSTVPDESVIMDWETKGIFEPEKATTTTIETYKILEGTDLENEITLLTAEEEGPSVFIVAGQHADEIASYTAINNLKEMELLKGKVYILSPANMPGFLREPKTRYVIDEQDLNRSFPGSIDGNEAERLAAAIYEEIKNIEPVIVLDHHEARTIKTDRDFLGSSFIYTTLNGIENLFLDMYQATHDGELCAEPYKFYSPGPIGSMNNVVATNLDIPVITVETYRGYELERRIEEQMAIAGYVLRYYEMVR